MLSVMLALSSAAMNERGGYFSDILKVYAVCFLTHYDICCTSKGTRYAFLH